MLAIGPPRLPYRPALIAMTIPLAFGALLYVPVTHQLRLEAIVNTAHTMHGVAHALARYGSEHEAQCPRSMKVLVNRGYLAHPAKDDWGTPIAFTCTSPFAADHALVVSAGPDRKLGTRDDIRTDR
ncbi:MAG TPA: hypothetical protein VN947_35695 [Polyangia bacterium]|nr:hypothetical protein [Polyangia bacterium]